MQIIIYTSVIINLFVILLLMICYLGQNKCEPKFKATCGFWFTVFLILYILSILLFVITESLIKLNFTSLFYLVFVIVPFIIGYYSNYKKLMKYTILQEIFFIISLILLILNI